MSSGGVFAHKAGVVWAAKATDYKGAFRSINLPIKWLPKKLQRKVDEQFNLDRLPMEILTTRNWPAFPSSISEYLTDFTTRMRATFQKLDPSSQVSIFYTPGSSGGSYGVARTNSKLAGSGGSFSISFGYSIPLWGEQNSFR